jgi:phosphoglycolate phosphatase-like HAD superfamily hydrolase
VNRTLPDVPRWDAVLFDLDGTLVDPRRGVRAAVAAAFTDVTGSRAPMARIDLSLPLEEMIRSADPSASEERRRLVSAAFRQHYDDGWWAEADVYPGAEHCLQELRAAGIRSFVVTNKRTVAAKRLLEHLHLLELFEAVLGQEDIGDPVPKQHLAGRCLSEAGLDSASTIAVGDSDQDAAMAEAWNIMFVAITNGIGPLSDVLPRTGCVEVESLMDASAFVLSTPGRKT